MKLVLIVATVIALLGIHLEGTEGMPIYHPRNHPNNRRPTNHSTVRRPNKYYKPRTRAPQKLSPQAKKHASRVAAVATMTSYSGVGLNAYYDTDYQ
ncbi:hypothetical protein PtA15_3A231 [Puccinia triticina]|nr:uncharacterized protein PtA15_3A231 [Puccinia triticina]WAQ82866.1 hypothetical protein PtA15_3A231 [Puccinia triticina]